jgi:hypothetical protein
VPQSLLVSKDLREISAVASVSLDTAREPGQQGWAPNFLLTNPLIHANQLLGTPVLAETLAVIEQGCRTCL